MAKDKKKKANLKARQDLYKYYRDLRRKAIKEAKIEIKLGNLIESFAKEGDDKDKVWVIRLKDGRKIKNKDKKEALKDFAVINGYEVI